MCVCVFAFLTQSAMSLHTAVDTACSVRLAKGALGMYFIVALMAQCNAHNNKGKNTELQY